MPKSSERPTDGPTRGTDGPKKGAALGDLSTEEFFADAEAELRRKNSLAARTMEASAGDPFRPADRVTPYSDAFVPPACPRHENEVLLYAVNQNDKGDGLFACYTCGYETVYRVGSGHFEPRPGREVQGWMPPRIGGKQIPMQGKESRKERKAREKLEAQARRDEEQRLTQRLKELRKATAKESSASESASASSSSASASASSSSASASASASASESEAESRHRPKPLRSKDLKKKHKKHGRHR